MQKRCASCSVGQVDREREGHSKKRDSSSNFRKLQKFLMTEGQGVLCEVLYLKRITLSMGTCKNFRNYPTIFFLYFLMDKYP